MDFLLIAKKIVHILVDKNLKQAKISRAKLSQLSGEFALTFTNLYHLQSELRLFSYHLDQLDDGDFIVVNLSKYQQIPYLKLSNEYINEIKKLTADQLCFIKQSDQFRPASGASNYSEKNREEQQEKVIDVWNILVERANNASIITYKELAAKLDLSHHHASRSYLRQIRSFCEKENLPDLTLLVASKGAAIDPVEGEKIKNTKYGEYEDNFLNQLEST